MARNLGKFDRVARGVAGAGMTVCGFMAPLPEGLRVFALLIPGVYVLGTAIVGTCIGYRLIGLSTCPARKSSGSEA